MKPCAIDFGMMVMCGLSLFATVSMAGRPLNVNDIEPVAAGKWQIEAGGAYRHDSGCDHFDYPVTLAYGVVKDLDLGVGFGGQFEERTEAGGTKCSADGLGDLTVYPRWKFLDQSRFLPGQAVSFSVKFPTADHNEELGSGATDYDLTWIASEKVTEKFQIDLNVGYSWIGRPQDEESANIFHYGLALEYQLFESVQWVGEVFAQREMTTGAETTIQCNTGFRYAACDGLTFDMAVGSGIRGEVPDFTAMAGLTWVFGPEKKSKNE
jgi:Putative MetA-pathway of phenol degradation